MSIFEKYAAQINIKELEASRKELAQNDGGGEYERVPNGKYEVAVNKMEAKISSKGNPMVSIWFKIVEGEHENSMIFYNGVYSEDWMRHRVAKMLSSILAEGDKEAECNLVLKSGNVEFVNEFVMDVQEAIEGKHEYLLDYGQNKGYDTFTIREVYDLA